MKRVKLILELYMGVYDDDYFEHVDDYSNPKKWEEVFYQSDTNIHDFDIVDVKIQEVNRYNVRIINNENINFERNQIKWY